MNWARAAIAGAVVVFLAFVVLVYVPDMLVTLTSVGRSTRVLLATVEFSVALCALLWALRKLQAHGLRR